MNWKFCSGFLAFLLGCVCLILAGCTREHPGGEVWVYSAADAEFAAPIFDDFTKQTSVAVRPKFDIESTKTIGLVQAIIAESNRPRCDVFWNNEILNTLRLQKKGLLEAYLSPAAADYPAVFRDPEGKWHGFAARARVLIVNTSLLSEPKSRPTSMNDFTAEKWRGKCAIAKPLFGSTATHAACLTAIWGEEKTRKFFDAMLANDVQVMSGNKQVALAVAAGEVQWGVTDTDDAIIELEAGKPVAIVYPDQAEGEPGTLFIPNTLAIIKGAPRPAEARKLVDYLLSPETEAKLSAGPSAQIPLNPKTVATPRVETPKTVRAMQIDFADAADAWDATAAMLAELFTGAK